MCFVREIVGRGAGERAVEDAWRHSLVGGVVWEREQGAGVPCHDSDSRRPGHSSEGNFPPSTTDVCSAYLPGSVISKWADDFPDLRRVVLVPLKALTLCSHETSYTNGSTKAL